MTGSEHAERPTAPLVLVVEGHDDTREMYAHWLAFSGLRVAQAASSAEAIEKARTLKPDVIATAVGFGGYLDGLHVTETLKAFAETQHIPIIAVTAWAMGGAVERARRAGCEAVLIKPCLPETLLAEIQRLLARKRD